MPCRLLQGVCNDHPAGVLSIEGLLDEYTIKDPEPWQAPRCVLLTNDTLLRVDKPGLWVDSLHLQIVAGLTDSPLLMAVSYTGSAFITNSVFQGDAESDARGLVCIHSVIGVYVQGACCEPDMSA